MQPSNADIPIRIIRGRRVILDRDLAALYGVSTGALNQAVRRNAMRFPPDFMFRLTAGETRKWISQIVITNPKLKMGARHAPYAFTEQGVAMLSSVLRSERAAIVNIGIMRAFVRLNRVLGSNDELVARIERVEERLGVQGVELGEHAIAIREILDDVRSLIGPPDGPTRRIGFASED